MTTVVNIEYRRIHSDYAEWAGTCEICNGPIRAGEKYFLLAYRAESLTAPVCMTCTELHTGKVEDEAADSTVSK